MKDKKRDCQFAVGIEKFYRNKRYRMARIGVANAQGRRQAERIALQAAMNVRIDGHINGLPVG
jgi:hypothetical protein